MNRLHVKKWNRFQSCQRSLSHKLWTNPESSPWGRVRVTGNCSSVSFLFYASFSVLENATRPRWYREKDKEMVSVGWVSSQHRYLWSPRPAEHRPVVNNSLPPPSTAISAQPPPPLLAKTTRDPPLSTSVIWTAGASRSCLQAKCISCCGQVASLSQGSIKRQAFTLESLANSLQIDDSLRWTGPRKQLEGW